MPTKNQPDLTKELRDIGEGTRQIVRLVNHPRVFCQVRESAGSELDKVSEVVLRALTGHSDTEMRLSDLAKRLGVELSSVSRKVHKLEENGFLRRTTDPKDARAWQLHLTETGQQELQKLDAVRNALLSDALADWPAEEVVQLSRLFNQFIIDLAKRVGEQ